MDDQCGGAVSQSTQQTGKTIQIHWFVLMLSNKSPSISAGVNMHHLVVLSVTCIIMQKNGAGLQTASACFWDNSTDGKMSHYIIENTVLNYHTLGKLQARIHRWRWCLFTINLHLTGSCAVRWENKSMYCIVSVFGLAIWDHGVESDPDYKTQH